VQSLKDQVLRVDVCLPGMRAFLIACRGVAAGPDVAIEAVGFHYAQ